MCYDIKVHSSILNILINEKRKRKSEDGRLVDDRAGMKDETKKVLVRRIRLIHHQQLT